MLKLAKTLVCFIAVFLFLSFSAINKANLSCEGLIDGEQDSLHMELVLYDWWHPISFLRGDFLTGREGYAKAWMYGKLNEGGTTLGTEYEYRITDSYGRYLTFRHGEEAVWGTFATLDQRQRFDGMVEGFDIDMKCAAAITL